ncbi:hypothetical protein TNCV_1255491 [Trichonephila clavipes]|nr:hypothetical protein TNCV_1255491 [Trichonephila clavipes]
MAQVYANEILRLHVMPYAADIDYSSLSMQDNAKCNTGRLVGNFLEAETMQRMEWPAFSADRNPIEHVWDTLETRVRKIKTSC